MSSHFQSLPAATFFDNHNHNHNHHNLTSTSTSSSTNTYHCSPPPPPSSLHSYSSPSSHSQINNGHNLLETRNKESQQQQQQQQDPGQSHYNIFRQLSNTPQQSSFDSSTPRTIRINRPQQLSFEESRKRAIEATELALASPRTRDQFVQKELEWNRLGADLKSPTSRPTTEQFYAQAEKQAEDSSLFLDRSLSASFRRLSKSSFRSHTSEYTTKSTDSPHRSPSTSSNESSSAFPVVARTSCGKRVNPSITSQTRLKPLTSVPESAFSRGTKVAMAQASEVAGAPPYLRNMPRSSSIDSAISTLSGISVNGASTPGKASSDEIAALISTAGSAELVIQHLIKDKSQAASQNAQLWRLVDKQRAMILSLNRDLEKAMKDKEKYRKKLKEHLAAVPPLPTHTPSTESLQLSEASTPTEQVEPDVAAYESGHVSPEDGVDPRHSERMDSVGSLDESIAPYPITPKAGFEQEHSLRQSAEEYMPSPTTHIAEAEANVAVSSSTLPPQFQNNARSKNIIPLELSSSSNTTLDESGMITPTVNRRKAPAPLQLQNSSQGYSIQHDNFQQTKDGEGKENIPLDMSRSTSDEVLRRSANDHTSANQSEERSDSPPMSPRMIKIGDLEEIPQGDSMKSTVLIAPGAGLSAKRQMNKSLPMALKSPNAIPLGLPLSPRPMDRPLASPMFAPRPPRDGGPTSPPLSPRAFVGLPQSPRGGFALQGGMSFVPSSPRVLSPRLKQSFLTNMSDQPSNSIGEQLMGIAPPMKALSKEIKVEEKPPGDYQRDTSLDNIAKGNDTNLLIVPPALQTIDPRVLSTRVKTIRSADSSKTREQLVFVMAVCSRSNGSELWRLEKDVNSLGPLDANMRRYANPKNFNARLPEKALFSSHAPAKVDARKVAIEDYFAAILSTVPLDERAAQSLCEYLSVDIVDLSSQSSDSGSIKEQSIAGSPYIPGDKIIKEGYLTKRGKNFGGWKSRFFVLDGPVLRYFETPGGAHLGSIRLPQAQIGKQSSQQKPEGEHNDSDNQYRHAFLILEPKRKDTSSVVRHVLCAESDAERDDWVACLMQYIDWKNEKDEPSPSSSFRDTSEAANENLRAVPYDATVPGQAPARGPTPPEGHRGTSPIPSIVTSPAPTSTAKTTAPISAPVNGNVITNATAWGNKPITHDKPKKKGIWGFRNKTSSEAPASSGVSNGEQIQSTRIPNNRSIFGAPLGDAVELSRPVGIDLIIPSVVYRTIEYLDAKNAAREEGIFRLSGSNTAIKALRERFNNETDYNLMMDEQYHDIHAVAGLLKLYLRELPATVLTRELHGDFLAVLESDDRIRRINRLNELVHYLPIENFTLLKLLASHLITIVDNCDVNKMTVRNVGIVFSPTLNIPAGVFSLFLLEFPSIFIKPNEEGYEEPSLEAVSNTDQNTHTTHLNAPSNGASVGLPSTPRKMSFDVSIAAEEKRRADQQNFRNLMETTRQEEQQQQQQQQQQQNNERSQSPASSLNVPTEGKKKRRESTMLGLFSSSKSSSSHFGKGKNEISPNSYDEDKNVYE